MCNNFPNIRITEGNNFSLVLPLRVRTYVATKPIDEDIDPALLQNIVVTFGGVEYQAQITENGVKIDLPATLAVGTYNILLTANYLESSIRAAYESAVTIVPWSAQSTAEQYIAGSPIVLSAAYVLSGALTDAELEELKEEWREKNAQLAQAIEDADAAKAEWERKAAELDDVAQQTTLERVEGKVEQATIPVETLQALSDNLQTMVNERNRIGGYVFSDYTSANGLGEAWSRANEIVEINDDTVHILTYSQYLYLMRDNLRRLSLPNLEIMEVSFGNNATNNIVELNLPKLRIIGTTSYGAGIGTVSCVSVVLPALEVIHAYNNFQHCLYLEELRMPKVTTTYFGGWCTNCPNLILLEVGEIIDSFNLADWNPAVVLADASKTQILLSNIREYIAAKIHNRIGMLAAIITFSSGIKNAILNEVGQATANAFANKNWIIA